MNILKLLSSRPWWVWLLIAVFVFLLVNEITGANLVKKMWNQAHDLIVAKDRQIAEDRARQIADLNERDKVTREELVRLRKDREALKGEVNALKTKNKDLQSRLDAVAVNLPAATDLDGLAKRFKERGYNPRVIVPGRGQPSSTPVR